jgi:hypothetical protein
VLLDSDTWQRYFHNFERSAWRLEVQPTYTMPNEQASIALFRGGEPKPETHNVKWHETVRANLAAGKTMGRVRVVSRPLTDYQRYQLAWGIPGNVAAGEDIRILDLSTAEVDLPEQDFWLFDDTTVVHLNFRPDGTLIDRELVEDPDLGLYRRWRDVALAYSVALADFKPDART